MLGYTGVYYSIRPINLNSGKLSKLSKLSNNSRAIRTITLLTGLTTRCSSGTGLTATEAPTELEAEKIPAILSLIEAVAIYLPTIPSNSNWNKIPIRLLAINSIVTGIIPSKVMILTAIEPSISNLIGPEIVMISPQGHNSVFPFVLNTGCSGTTVVSPSGEEEAFNLSASPPRNPPPRVGKLPKLDVTLDRAELKLNGFFPLPSFSSICCCGVLSPDCLDL